MKRPAFQFYPADWRKDMALQSCSVAARGLWMDMLCIAHECEPYGHLTVNGRPMTAAQIGRHTGLTERECAKLVAELEEAGVLSRSDEGAIFSRRMVRDEDLRQRRADGGKAGSEHGQKGAEHGSKGGRPRKQTGDKKPPSEPPIKPPPSSSSSSSTSVNTSVPDGTGAFAPQPPDPADVIFGLGVPLLTAAGVSDRNARSMLGLQRKQHGDSAVVEAITRCAAEKPIQPVPWLQAALKAKPQPNKRAAVEDDNRRIAQQWGATQ